MLGPFRAIRRYRLRRRPFPEAWIPHLDHGVPFYADLSSTQKRRFHGDLKLFVWEKHFIAAGGLEITDEIRVVIAAAAVRLILHLDISYYDRLTEIVVYPSHFHEADNDQVVFGQAWDWGIVVLSWDAVVQGLQNPDDGHDTATHEFAHVLDRADGEFDGTPKLRAYKDFGRWAQVMSTQYLALRKKRRAQRRVMRRYGATNEAEFFAVATESFFEKPRQMRQHTPDLYDELQRFYGFDPAAEGADKTGDDKTAHLEE